MEELSNTLLILVDLLQNNANNISIVNDNSNNVTNNTTNLKNTNDNNNLLHEINKNLKKTLTKLDEINNNVKKVISLTKMNQTSARVRTYQNSLTTFNISENEQTNIHIGQIDKEQETVNDISELIDILKIVYHICEYNNHVEVKRLIHDLKKFTYVINERRPKMNMLAQLQRISKSRFFHFMIDRKNNEFHTYYEKINHDILPKIIRNLESLIDL